MGRNLVETLMGAVVLLVAGLFLAFAYSTTRVQVTRGYELSAKFDRIDGLRVGSDVRLSGIRVGSVVDARLEPNTYLAIIRLSLDSSVRLPVDTVAEVASDGLLGGNFVALVPGGDDQIIPPGGEIRQTQSPVNLVHLLGRIIFSATENENARAQSGQGQRGQTPAPPR
jgi:phospholipid/cholesterol/gamma-HCH transport system substrate-binding protein